MNWQQDYEMVRFFEYEHLPTILQEVSKPFAELVLSIVKDIEPSYERTATLRKLLEAKDCAVRAKLLTTNQENWGKVIDELRQTIAKDKKA